MVLSTLRRGGDGAEIASRSGRGVERSGVGTAGSGVDSAGCGDGSVGSGGSDGTVPSSGEQVGSDGYPGVSYKLQEQLTRKIPHLVGSSVSVHLSQ